MMFTDAEAEAMRRACELARQGEGFVEPNPMVGAVVLSSDGRTLGEGWHARFGGPHAEVMALEAAGTSARGATLVVSLEPCCHHGKTPPCVTSIVTAGIARVVVGTRDPSPRIDGRGIAALAAAGISVEVGVDEPRARRLIAPFAMLATHQRPWVIVKWAMSLDGRVATASGESRWISCEASRSVVHALRGRVDAILVGIGTALADDPLLTARPSGPRRAIRIVLDSNGRLPLDGRLVRTAAEIPLLVVVGNEAPESRLRALRDAGCEIWQVPAPAQSPPVEQLLAELGRRQVTNLLVEGGPSVLGRFRDARLIDEVWAFVAPLLIGGAKSPAVMAGADVARLSDALPLSVELIERHGPDLLVRGVVSKETVVSGN